MRSSLPSVLLLLGACTPTEPESIPPRHADEPAAREPKDEHAPPAAEAAPAPTPPSSPTPRPEPCTGVPVDAALPAHPDLELRLKSKVRGRVELWQPIELVATLANRSKTQHHAAVLTGDGSEMGWREPQVWFSGFVDTGDGCWQPLAPKVRPRCGVYDADWSDEVVTLKPGERSRLEWIPDPLSMLDVQDSGRVRIYLHYAYRAGEADRGETPTELGALEGADAFELVSEPIEFDVLHPLKLELSARSAAPSEDVSVISELVDLQLTNLGSKDRRLSPVTSETLEFEIEGGTRRYSTSPQSGSDPSKHVWIDSGESVSLLDGPGASPWYPASAGVYRIRASYQPFAPGSDPPLRSNWIEVELR